MPESIGFVIKRQAAALEFFRADPTQGFLWTKDKSLALRFARSTDAESVAAIVADDCEVAPADDVAIAVQVELLGYTAAMDRLRLGAAAAVSAIRANANFEVVYLGDRFVRVVHSQLETPEATISIPTYTPSVEDVAASDWSIRIPT
jgi:hypothetical protein